MSSTVRVASVQMALHAAPSPDVFLDRIANHVGAASEYGCDFLCFPEHFTLQLIAGAAAMVPAEATVDALTEHTGWLRTVLGELARTHGINIIGGSHATRLDDGSACNLSVVARRDGSVTTRSKLHPTPDERDAWGISGGAACDAIDTDCGPVGVLICYDSEFPEPARRLADQGARLIFVPYLTDTRHGHLRVRYCCHARTVENQCYVVTAGLCGNLANTANLDMAYAQSAILTPSDHGFARDGIAAQAEAQVEQMIFADLDMGLLARAREAGAVRNLADRRPDLYSVTWRGEPSPAEEASGDADGSTRRSPSSGRSP